MYNIILSHIGLIVVILAGLSFIVGVVYFVCAIIRLFNRVQIIVKVLKEKYGTYICSSYYSYNEYDCKFAERFVKVNADIYDRVSKLEQKKGRGK